MILSHAPTLLGGSVETEVEDDFSSLDSMAWIIDGSMPPDSGEGNDGDYATERNNQSALDIYQKSGGSWSVVGQKDGTTGAVPANLGHDIPGYDQLFEKTFWGSASGGIRLYKDDWTNSDRIQGLSPSGVSHGSAVEVLSKVRAGNDWHPDGLGSIGVFLAGKLAVTSDDAQGYFAILQHQDDAISGDTDIRVIRKAAGGARTTLAGPATVDSQDHDFERWLRFRMDPDVDGIRLRAKAWLTTDSEPGWDIDVVDTSPLDASGRLGMASFRRQRNIDRWNHFSYSLTGGTASGA